MLDWPLLISQLIQHAARVHGMREIVSVDVDGVLLRYSWRAAHDRAKKLMRALTRLGVKRGDRVASLAWNTHRHLEMWFAVAGMGAIAHTINPRLFRDQISYIVNHADDVVLMFDVDLTHLVQALLPTLPRVRHVIAMADRGHASDCAIPNLLYYEELVATENPDHPWPALDESTPSGLCYTSGTTGQPKGVLYTHRSTVLHTMAICAPDAFNVRAASSVLPVVPMFHVHAWGLPFATAAQGAKLVLNGHRFAPKDLLDLIHNERVTLTGAVPTVWLGMLQALRSTGRDLGPLEMILIGGSAVSRTLLEALQSDYGVEVRHAWGMTELSPVGTVNVLPAGVTALSTDERIGLQLKQGRPPFGVEMEVVDERGERLTHDGVSAGRLKVRGPWVSDGYFRSEGDNTHDGEGFFDTGDVAVIDPAGYMKITDRAKDVIKSGGEWISSIELENAVVAHPDVTEAAVIGIPHPEWQERPLLFVVKRSESIIGKKDVREFLKNRVPRWWLPDDVTFVEELPHTATGKINKRALREQVLVDRKSASP